MSNFIKLISLSLKLPLLGVVFFHFIPNYIKKTSQLKKIFHFYISIFKPWFEETTTKQYFFNVKLVREQTNHLAGK